MSGETAISELLDQVRGLRTAVLQVQQQLSQLGDMMQQSGPALGLCADCVDQGPETVRPALVWLAGQPLCVPHFRIALQALKNAGGGLVAATGPVPPQGPGLLVPDSFRRA